MPAERWGAYSVIDHRDALKIARDLILFDRLLLPTPMDWDMEEWRKRGWDPEGLLARIDSLGDRAIRARWTPERRADWAETFASLREDEREVNGAAYGATRRVLIEQAREFKPAGVPLVEAFEGFQSEAAFVAHSSAANAAPDPQAREETAILVMTQRLAVPLADDPEEAMRRALEMSNDPRFAANRAHYYDWQRALVDRGHRPRDIVEAARALAEGAERAAAARGRDFGAMTAATAVSLGTGTISQFADLGVHQEAFGLGVFAFGTFMTLRGWLDARQAARTAPAPVNAEQAVGAMFHETKRRLGWEIG